MTYYKASKLFNKIERVEVDRETEHFVIINGRREIKNSDSHWYCPTREEAKAELVASRQSDVDTRQIWLDQAKQKLAKAQSL